MIKEFLKKEWKYLIGLLVFLIIISVGYYEYKTHKSPPMATVNTIDYAEIAKAMQLMNIKSTPAETKYITDKITEVKQLPPQIVYVSKDQASSDKTANDLAKKDKGDFVIKEQTSAITNSFYSVHTERNHKIKMGATVIANAAYANLGYQQNKNEYIVHYSPIKQDYGFTYMRTLKEW